METVDIYQIMQAILRLARDLVLLFAPLIGLLAGMKFVTDFLHRYLFGRKS